MLRKRKMMLVLPLLALPFITMAFGALCGGKGTKPKITINQVILDINLPDVNLKEDNLTYKISFYEKADQDSIKKEEPEMMKGVISTGNRKKDPGKKAIAFHET